MKPLLGRVFSPNEYGDTQGGYPVAVISYGLWNRRFHRDPGVAGQRIRVNRQELTIVGVAPEHFIGTITGIGFEVWIPVMMASQLNAIPDWMVRDRQSRILLGVAGMKRWLPLTCRRAARRASTRTRRYGASRVVGQDGIPISLSFPKTGDSAVIVGQTPRSARVPLDPLFGNRINFLQNPASRRGRRLRSGGTAPLRMQIEQSWEN